MHCTPTHVHAPSYTPNGGSLDLREEIALLYGPAIAADNILVFTGAQVALQTAAMALASTVHSIAFNAELLAGIQQALGSSGVVIQFPDELSPILVKPSGKEQHGSPDSIGILMPIRMS